MKKKGLEADLKSKTENHKNRNISKEVSMEK
jgi:hypothetical protein